MAITTGNHPKELWPGVKAFFGKEYMAKPTVYSQVFTVGTSDKGYEEIVEDTGMGLAPVKAEGAGITYDTTRQGYVTRLVNVVYGLGGIVTEEAIEDNQYESKAMRVSARLARSMRQTKETVHANVLNRGFNSAYVGGDGKELLATDHPTMDGTQSNELAVAADFSEASLEDLLIQIRQAKDSKGLRIQIDPVKLVIPPALYFEATRVLSSTNQSGTANNDTNAVRATGVLPGGTVTWDYLTDSDAWFVLTDAPEGLLSMQRRALKVEKDNDFQTGNALMKATERYLNGWGDWRGVFGSAGA